MTQHIELELHIAPEEYLKYYRGAADPQVLATARDGRRVRFPARILQPFVLHDGVRGLFRIEFDAAGRFQRIVRVR
ncbi:MAG: DUF2835 domain-containing protein [Oceanospirillaceae bacterium]|nr:DUF2835 domain-containing protein [Oceanospirillaceae bacterium]